MFQLPALLLLSSFTYAQSSSSSSSSTNATSSSATTSSTATSSSSSPTPSSTSGKRGIAYALDNNPEDVLNFNQTSSLITWLYSWSASTPSYLTDSGLEVIPMQWGSEHIEDFADHAQSQNAETVLIFNEPDFTEQSNIPAETAAVLWKRYIEPMKQEQGVRIGGPSITSSGTGIPWLQQFMNECADCSVDFLCIHWYGEGTQGFYDFVYQVHALWPDMKVWVTEYADTSLDVDVVSAFMKETTAFMDATDWIERYAWFGFFRPDPSYAYNFLDYDGGLTALGRTYIGAETKVKTGPAEGDPADGASSLTAWKTVVAGALSVIGSFVLL